MFTIRKILKPNQLHQQAHQGHPFLSIITKPCLIKNYPIKTMRLNQRRNRTDRKKKNTTVSRKNTNPVQLMESKVQPLTNRNLHKNQQIKNHLYHLHLQQRLKSNHLPQKQSKDKKNEESHSQTHRLKRKLKKKRMKSMSLLKTKRHLL